MLIDDGHDVVGLDARYFEGCGFGEPIVPLPAVDRDLRDVSAGDLEGVDAVLHLGALSNDPLGDLNPDITYSINHRAVITLAEAAKAAGVERFVFSSSCSLYGAGGDGLLDEEAPMAPVTAYGESKVLAERDLSALADDDFTPVYLRNATAYGVSPQLRLDIVVNNLTAWAVTTGQVRILSDGSPWRPLVHVADICDAFRACLTAPREGIHDQAINIGRNGENYQIRDVAEIVGEVVPGSVVTFAEGGEPDTRDYRVDFSKAVDVLPDFRPAWDVRSGAEELYEAYVANGFSTADFEGEKYFRIRRIRSHLGAGRLSGDLRWAEPVPGQVDP
jgi:nucleoside-diphosphate-sugar epimerase